MMHNYGIVEGFYGRLYSFSARNVLVETLQKNNLNSYFYAPKEDPFLRSNFHLNPSENWRAEFKDFVAYASERSIEVSVGLTPHTKEHIDQLGKKIDYFVQLGCTKIALLFDDLETFDAEAQFRALDKSQSSFPQITFSFCPTVYCNELIEKDSFHKDYFNYFLANCPKGTDIIWTGEKVISTILNTDAESKLDNIASENISIWDNYFTIDSCPKRLNFTNFNHLNLEYLKNKRNYFVNLTGMERTDRLIVDLQGNFFGSNQEEFNDLLQRHGLTDELVQMIDLFDPQIKIKLSDSDKEKLHKIIFSWFHPLKNEWYPYLHNLKNWG